jgi:hypothetical protein
VKAPFSDVDEARVALLARLAASAAHSSGGAL